jgi:thiosulfate/3-mercaptopyruvate sulfurtransferase
MSHTTLISASQLMALQARQQPLVLLDCGFDLSDPGAGERAFAAAHLPGAQYAHLDRDFSGTKTGRNGRHPLPARDALSKTLGRWGVTPGLQVVTYDDHGGVYAARAWWLLRWMGHTDVAVLDGGRAAWARAGGTLSAGLLAAPEAPPYPASAQPAMRTVDAQGLQRQLATGAATRLFDARAGERFRGEVEPLDPVAGHIPGATLRFFKDNLGPDGCFKAAEQLRAEFAALGAGPVAMLDPSACIHQCGSGVTACHNLLAMRHAGLGDSVLYPGSWSEWCSDPARPVATGP